MLLQADKLNLVLEHIRDVPDFPKPGILFKDITPLCADAAAFSAAIDLLEELIAPLQPDSLVAIDARGFLLGGALSQRLHCGVVLLRKQGKLPADTLSASYELEYGEATVEMHRDALRPGERIVIVDDLLATGGTVEAAIQLCRELKADILASVFLIELNFLGARERLAGIPVMAPVQVGPE